MLDGEHIIIERAVGGESSAFGLLYDHYQPQIYRFVILKVGRREEAEDLTHQVFLAALRNIGSYKHLGHPFSSWLYQIARNHVIDHYRMKRPEVELEEADTQGVAHLPSDNEDIDREFKMEDVRSALGTLAPHHQDIIIMRFIEELSIKEIAAALEKSEGSVKVMQHRAMRELKRALGE